jgi:protein-L-isoaspartate(D-aspartate) O-methyltransferase
MIDSLDALNQRSQSERLRRRLVTTLRHDGWIRSARVRDAFLAVPRELFVADFAAHEGLGAVYADEAIVTRVDPQGLPLSSSSQPAVMALMLEQLDLEDGMTVLEIGAGTGYNAALLSLLVGPRGRVVSMDVDGETANAARRALRTAGYSARVAVGDGRDGFSDGAPYDRILVTASSDAVPFAWFEQLKADGLLQVPLRVSATGVQVIPLLRKRGRAFRSISVVGGGFMPLRGADETAAASAPPTLRVTDASAGSPKPIRELYGEALATLSPRAKRRLLSIVLEDGRRRSLGVRGNSRSLALFVALRLPARKSCSTAPKFGIGALTRDGASIALLEFARRSRVVDSMRVFGSERAVELLMAPVREWDRRGRPTESDLAITAAYDADGRTRLRHRWPQQTR